MRILVHGSIFPDSFTHNIMTALIEMGHTVTNVPVWQPPAWLHYSARVALVAAARRGWIGDPAKALFQEVRRFQPDLFLNAYAGMNPLLVSQLRRQSRAIVAVWYPDTAQNFGRQYLLASDYHAWFFKDRHIVDFFRRMLGLPAYYLPQCCQPRWHHRVELTDADRARYGCDLTTACNMYYYRARQLEPFVEYNFKIWGRSFPPWLRSPVRRVYQNHYVAQEEKAKAFNAAKIVLNTLHYSEIHGVNQRLFEIAGCGAFQIAEYREAMQEYFEPETEVVTFRSRDELKEKVDYYLAHPEERQPIADRAYARAHREHTYQHRLRALLEVVAGLREGQPAT